MQMNKKGQFFLIAALITVGALFGVTSIINSAQRGDENERFYDLSHEINFETKRVIDYGVYWQDDTNSLVNSFLVNYADYIKQDKALFIFGNEQELQGLYFANNPAGVVGLSVGSSPTVVPIQQVTGAVAHVTREGNVVNVKIGEITYTFSLLEGQNFFLVIEKEENNNVFVATS
jgi:hypothetical protein